MVSLIDELRRRNVLKIAAAYALVAWILIEAGSVLLPTFGAPDWFFRIYVIIVIAGWVVSMIFAWVYEITPDGVRLEKNLDRSRYTPSSGSTLNYVIIGLLVLALGVSVAFNFLGVGDPEATQAGTEQTNSIAVLPFENRSSDPESQYFTDGIHDDLLTRLSHVESLRVISRTSVMGYRDTARNLREIGQELGVSTIVEGAVQQYGEKVRITIQLIDAASDRNIWADSYDRVMTMENVFDIQTEISSEIAASLRTALSPEDELEIATVPTTNIDAYTLYVSGRRNLYRRRFETLQAARQEFERAVEIDPGFAEAYAGLAETVMVLLTNHKAVAPSEAYDIASRATAKALELNPQLAIAHALTGMIESSQWQQTRLGDGNVRAASEFRKALDINPNLADAYVWYALLMEHEARYDEGIELLRKALQVDPLSRIPYVNLPSMHAAKGENLRAIELLLRSMEVFPNWPIPYEYMTDQLARMGRLDESVAWALLAMELSDDPVVGASVLPIFNEFGYVEAMNAFLDSFPTDHPLSPIGIGYQHYLNEEYEQAIATLDPTDRETAWQFSMVYPLLVRSAVLLEDYDKAYEYLMHGYPALAGDAIVTIDRISLGAVVMQAFLEQKRGNDAVAERLLNDALEVARRLPRNGLSGHGIKDVKILALLGHPDAALDALREAMNEGFVSLMPFDIWGIDRDPMLESLRSLPRYEKLRIELGERLELQRAEIERAHETGNWQPLRDRVNTI